MENESWRRSVNCLNYDCVHHLTCRPMRKEWMPEQLQVFEYNVWPIISLSYKNRGENPFESRLQNKSDNNKIYQRLQILLTVTVSDALDKRY